MGLRPHFLMITDTRKNPNWRNGVSLKCCVEYRRKFAWWRKICSDGTKVWFKSYYKRYEHWIENHRTIEDAQHGHTDLVEYVSEADYIVRKLTEGI